MLRGVLRGLDGAADALVVILPPQRTLGDELERLLRRLASPGLVKGAILLASVVGLREEDVTQIAELYRTAKGERLVSIGVAAPGIPAIGARDGSGIRDAVEHLVRVHRFRRLGFLAGPSDNPEANRRLAAFLRESRARNAGNEPIVIPNGDFSFDAGQEGAQALLAPRPNDIDAIIAANDEMAFGALRYIERRYDDPKKRPAVIGFDDTEYAAAWTPRLTTVRQPLDEEGYQAALAMLELTRTGKVETLHRELGTKLRVRESCGCTGATHRRGDGVRAWLSDLASTKTTALLSAFEAGLLATHSAQRKKRTADTSALPIAASGHTEELLANATSSDIGAWQQAVGGLRGAALRYLAENTAAWLDDPRAWTPAKVEHFFDDLAQKIAQRGRQLDVQGVQRRRDLSLLRDGRAHGAPHAKSTLLEDALRKLRLEGWVCRTVEPGEEDSAVEVLAGANGARLQSPQQLITGLGLPARLAVYALGPAAAHGHFAIELKEPGDWGFYSELYETAAALCEEQSPEVASSHARSDLPPRPEHPRRDHPANLDTLSREVELALERMRTHGVPFRTASVQLLDGDLRSLVVAHGFARNKVNRFLLRPISDDALVRGIRDTKQPVFAGDTAKLPSWTAEPSQTAPILAWIGAPVVKDDNVIALLTLDFDSVQPEIDAYRPIVSQFVDDLPPLLALARPLLEVDRLSAAATLIKDAMDMIARTPNLDQILRWIVDRVTEELNCSHCTLFLAERVGGELRLKGRCAAGSQETLERTFALWSTQKSLAAKVFETGVSLVVPNVNEEQDDFAKARTESAKRSMLVVAIKVGKQAIGVISADQNAEGWFHPRDAELVEALARQAGLAIQRSHSISFLRDIGALILAAQSTTDILEKVVDSAVKLTNTSSGVIYHLSRDHQTILDHYPRKDVRHPRPRLGHPDSLTERIIRERKAIPVPDIEENKKLNQELKEKWKSLIAVPLLIGAPRDDVIGVLFVDSEVRHEFTEIEQSLLEILAGQAAIALEKAERTWRHDQLDLQLNRLHTAAAESDLPAALQHVAASVSEILIPLPSEEGEPPAVSAGVRLYDPDSKIFGPCYASGPLAGVLKEEPRLQGGTARFVVDNLRETIQPDVKNPPPGHPSVRDRALSGGIRSFAALPLTSAGRIAGVLFVMSTRKLEFTDDEKRVLSLFANHVGSVIANTSRHRAYKRFAYNLSERIGDHLGAYDAVHSRLEELCAEGGQGDVIREQHEKLGANTNSLKDWIKALRTFGEVVELSCEVCNLNEVVKAVVESENGRLDTAVTLEDDLSAGASEPISLDRRRIEGCIRQLIKNALGAVTSARVRTIRVFTERQDGFLRVGVDDSGGGFPPGSALQAPFQGKDPACKGIGLILVDETVRAHSGSLTRGRSKLGGASVVIDLPLRTERDA
ncbi:MAG TPA: GAF domain-containing protein [Polyangiaceae bacterium]|nr:GAF domain-containing protein [Polyangiaceae bacterium]